ncbi:unnamed protein product [Camellia sinensis]
MLWVTIRRRILCQALSLQRCFRSLWNQILACTLGKSCTYRQLPHTTTMSSLSLVASERGFETPDMPCGCCEHSRDSSDLVALKISLLGDSQIGKTSFLTMYVGGERQEEGFEISNSRLNQMDKTLYIGGCCQMISRIKEMESVTAIPVLIGTKFNDFVQLPIDVQWTIASQL